MYKVLTIAWKELYTRFTDRNLILIMIASPLAIATIVGLAFGGLGSDDVPIQDIPVAVVNHDRGNAGGMHFGQTYVDLFVSGANGEPGGAAALPLCEAQGETVSPCEAAAGISLDELVAGVAFDAQTAEALVASGEISPPKAQPGSEAYVEAAAGAAVEAGIYTAALLIPPNYSESLTSLADPAAEPLAGGLVVYANRGRPISAGIVRSIVEGISNQLLTGNIAIGSTLAVLGGASRPAPTGPEAGGLDMAGAFACAFDPQSNTIIVDAQTIQGAERRSAGSAILVAVGSSQAMFFALFTAQFGVLSLHNERQNWTLQRLITSPTPRSAILGGKLLGVFGSVVFQLLALMVALTIVGSILEGRLTLIWGNDFLRLGLVLISASLAVSGLGMLLAGIVRTVEQAQVIGSVVNMALAVMGGAFGFLLPFAISSISMLYWGREAFYKLALGQGDISLNVAVLLAQGALMYLLGLFLFNRRFEV